MQAVQFAHSRNVVLRDMQPDALFLSDNPSTSAELVRARIFDVSLARKWPKGGRKAHEQIDSYRRRLKQADPSLQGSPNVSGSGRSGSGSFERR